MALHGKRYEALEKQFDRQKYYPLAEAVGLVKGMANTKFDETIELHFHLGIDPRHSDQQVRSTVLLPHGLGKSVRVLVFADGEDARAALAAGADLIADDDVIRSIQELKACRVEFRNDKTANLHVPVGKASFEPQKILENAQAIFDAVNRVKPSAVEGVYV